MLIVAAIALAALADYSQCKHMPFTALTLSTCKLKMQIT